MKIVVQEADFDVGAEVAALSAGDVGVGAVATFVGLVRGGDAATGEVAALTLEHYPGMTERALEGIVAEARRRWSVTKATVIHRVGRLCTGDRIVLVAVASAHRGDAFAACEFIMDYLKTQAPFWKREATPEGDRWVEARDADEAAAARWTTG